MNTLSTKGSGSVALLSALTLLLPTAVKAKPASGTAIVNSAFIRGSGRPENFYNLVDDKAPNVCTLLGQALAHEFPNPGYPQPLDLMTHILLGNSLIVNWTEIPYNTKSFLSKSMWRYGTSSPSEYYYKEILFGPHSNYSFDVIFYTNEESNKKIKVLDDEQADAIRGDKLRLRPTDGIHVPKYYSNEVFPRLDILQEMRIRSGHSGRLDLTSDIISIDSSIFYLTTFANYVNQPIYLFALDLHGNKAENIKCEFVAKFKIVE